MLEGLHAVKHALRFGARLQGCWTADRGALDAALARLAPDVASLLAGDAVTVVDPDALAAEVPRAELLAVAERPRQADLLALLADRDPAPVVLLEDPRHLGNLGACVRVAAAAGAAGVLTTGRQDPWHPDALRGSAGLHFALPVIRTRAFPDRAARAGRALVACDPGGDPLGAGGGALPPRALLAFGTERDGLSDELLADADARVALPMRAGVSSLNLATSVAAVLYRAGAAGVSSAGVARPSG